jgi:hypothetical protein
MQEPARRPNDGPEPTEGIHSPNYWGDRCEMLKNKVVQQRA